MNSQCFPNTWVVSPCGRKSGFSGLLLGVGLQVEMGCLEGSRLSFMLLRQDNCTGSYPSCGI